MGPTGESSSAIVYQVKGSAKWMVWGGMTGRGLTSLHFIPQGQTVMAEYYITKILEKEVKPLFSRRSTTEEPVKRKQFHEQKQCDLLTRLMAHQLMRRKQPTSGARKTSRILSKKMNGQQIHLILTPLKTYGESLTKLHTEIRSLRRWED